MGAYADDAMKADSRNQIKAWQSIVQHSCLLHDFRHRETCFKRSKGNGCRFNMPRDIVENDKYDPVTHEMKFVRRAGSQWLTEHQIDVTILFNSNNNLRFMILTGDGAAASYYVTNYTTKPQQMQENSAVVFSAYTNRLKKEEAAKRAGVSLPPAVAGLRRLMSLLSTMTSTMEMGGPLACLYLLKGGNVYMSHKLSRFIFLPQVLNFLNSDSLEAPFYPSVGEKTVIVSDMADYLFRPVALQDSSFWRYAQCGAKESRCKQRAKKRIGDLDLKKEKDNVAHILSYPQLPNVLLFEDRLFFYRSE
eukprot:Pompholyxophrys_sp_v1_NODE_35_length_3421_cov_8.138146.p2 type:complete len:305 gc:universal NODE_35_length_3421_cov_8.138146:2418-3332(+)